MICKISDLFVEVPAAGGMASRCRNYLYDRNAVADIVIREERYRKEEWPNLSVEDMIYMESGVQFYVNLLLFSGLMLHASAIERDGRAYLFSGPCGVGKSTHTLLWQAAFGESARVFNDDKPALRYMEGRWYAYGTPWCGKDSININMKVPLAGICFLKQSERNRIRRLGERESLASVLAQTRNKLYPREMNYLLDSLDNLIREIPIFELENRPEPEAARLSYETMRRAAEEAGL